MEDMHVFTTKREAIIALKMFVMSGIMVAEGMRSLGGEEEVVRSTFMAWMQAGSEMFGKDVFCKACMMEITLMQNANDEISMFNMNQVVQC